MKRWKGVLAAATLGVSSQAWCNPEVSAFSEHDTILAIGDSLTAGAGVKRDETYPALLSKRIAAKVIASGRNGETSAAMVARLPRELKRAASSFVILCSGGNDLLRSLSVAELQSNLEQAIDLVREAGARPVLVAIPVPGTKQDHPVYRRVAQHKDVPVIEGIGALLGPEHFLRDGVHPNAAGYRVIVDEMMRFFGG
ncbi:GDSL-type esterase/lipase family protein [Marivita sp.]|uniref:GDSL-type esterase/lipase family protein n=1 Tax=Marivita sp. TaxID=2003365 RepID=UPI00321A21D1